MLVSTRLFSTHVLLTLGLMAGMGSVAGCTSSDAEGDDAASETGETGADDGGVAPGPCARVMPAALRTCVVDYGAALQGCYEASGRDCPSDNAAVVDALDALTADVTAACAEEGAFGLDADALAGRLANACASESGSLAWRAYGGPQGDPWDGANEGERACQVALHAAGVASLDQSLEALDVCAQAGTCDAGVVETARTNAVSLHQEAAAAACEGINLETFVALGVDAFGARAAHQGECLAAAGISDLGDATLGCGPSNADFTAPRGEWTQIVVDGDKWGTLCGDGTDYAFQIRLAPEGNPLDRVLVGLQGGGVCVFEDDCTAKLQSAPDLFNALDDQPFGLGIASDDPAESPFANWTKIYLPYCNQDVFAGGGVVEVLGDLELPRYGAVNLRAALSMTRDVLWREMDAEGGAGFRPDELIALFGGWSAGGYGTLYNYHWLIDDLQWPRTAAFPDAGMALDNGELLGVAALGQVKIPAWGTQRLLPPYCFEGGCAVGPVLYEAISPRLKRFPEQQFLIVSNPKDDIQQGDAYFSDTPSWINAMRESVCDTRDLKGINYYLTSVSDESLHCVTLRPELWSGSVDGEVMKDWFWRAVTEPDTLETRVEEGDFVDVIPGVQPYPCAVAP